MQEAMIGSFPAPPPQRAPMALQEQDEAMHVTCQALLNATNRDVYSGSELVVHML